MPSVSIIVPVFNSAPYIESCLDSMVAQTLDDIEIVIVDDHGIDGSMDIVRSFVDNYEGPKQIVLTSTPFNSGPGAARNVGIGQSRGKYVGFVDSDDIVDPGFCKELYELAEREGADMACCDISINGETRCNADVSDKKSFLRHFVSYFTTFIYSRKMLEDNGIGFPEGFSAEDTCFLIECCLCARKMAQTHKSLYMYRMRGDSVSKENNPKRAHERLASMKAVLVFARTHGYFGEYFLELWYLFLKKGLGMAVKDKLSWTKN